MITVNVDFSIGNLYNQTYDRHARCVKQKRGRSLWLLKVVQLLQNELQRKF